MLIGTFFFILGAVIGSFLNVVIHRMGTHRTLGGRSICMSCERTLRWYELVPLLSFFALNGRCRTCKSKISGLYPAVELLSALLFLGLYLKFEDIVYLDIPIFALVYGYYAFQFSLLMIIAVYDLRHKIIPDRLVSIFGVVALAGLFLFDVYGFRTHIPSLQEFLAGFYISIPFALLWLLSGGRWMGLGDAKLAIGLGWLLGLSRVLSATVISFWSGAIIGVLLIFFSRGHGMKSEIPFAPFLVFGAVLAFLLELHMFPIL